MEAVTLSELLTHPAVRGVCIGNCPTGEDLGLACRRTIAHAHVYQRSKYSGWICVHKPADLNKCTMIHEIAHLTVGHGIHNERWRKAVRKLGGRIEHQYRLKTTNVH